jgi:uncharacterized protein (TIGR03067 family)
MRRVLPLLIVLSLGFAPAPVYRGLPAPGKADLDAMQGAWKLVYYEVEGKSIEPERKAPNGLMRIKGGRMLNFFRCDCDVSIDASRRTRTIDATGSDGGHLFRILGIYKIEGDVLTVCWPKTSRMLFPERPVDFDAPGTRCRFERKKP